jgi:hypothetical protein
MLDLKLDLSEALQGLDDLQAACEEDVRPAAQAGAQVYYDEARVRVPVRKSARVYKGKTYQPGALKAAIYQAYSKDNSAKGRATFHISWNARKAPHGHLIEHGHWTKTRKAAAAAAAQQEFIQRIKRRRAAT